MADLRRDIHGNTLDWSATGRRLVGTDGHLRAELRRDAAVFWPAALPHDDCLSCQERIAHVGCPVLVLETSTKERAKR